MFSVQGKLLLVFLSCIVWSLIDCDGPCVKIMNGEMYTYKDYHNINVTSKDYFLFDIYGRNTSILSCHPITDNCTVLNNSFTLSNGPDYVGLNFTVLTTMSKITVFGSNGYTNSTCFLVTAHPSSFSCNTPSFYPTASSPYARIDCMAANAYLTNVTTSCSLYKQDSNQSMLVTSCQQTTSAVAALYNYTCLFNLYSLDAGTNKFTVIFNDSYKLFSATVPEFTYTELNILKWTTTSASASLGNNVTMTCETKFIPAQKIRITRKGLNQQLNESLQDSRTLVYTITNFSCNDVDEYECTIFNTTDQKSSTYIPISGASCPPKILYSSQQNKVFTAKPGGSVIISVNIFTTSTSSTKYNLYFEENGQIFMARTSLYSTNCNPNALYYCSLNIALFDLTESDFRNYFLSVKYSNLEDFANFTLSLDSSDPTKDALIGVAVVAGVLFIVILILVVVVIFLYRRRPGIKMDHQPVQRTAVYDGVNQAENYGHNYGDNQVNQGKVLNAPKPVEDEAKYEAFNTHDQHATATKPPSAAGHKKPKLEPPKARPVPPPPLQEDTYELTTNGPTEHYGNANLESDQPVYGNLRDSS